MEKPEFPKLHYHPYVHSGWASSSLKPVAEVPAMLQPSYVRSLFERTRNKFLPSLQPSEPEPNKLATVGQKVGEKFEVALTDVPVGEVRAISGAFCVARLSETEAVALTRRCPHAAGDLVNGWVDGRNVVCPWHNLPFDAESGQSPCKSLARLKRVQCEIVGDVITIDPKTVLNAEAGDEALVAAE